MLTTYFPLTPQTYRQSKAPEPHQNAEATAFHQKIVNFTEGPSFALSSSPPIFYQMETIHLAIIEDDRVTRENLKIYLDVHPSIVIEFAEDSVEAFLTGIKQCINPCVDILLLDIGLPGMTGIEGIQFIKKELPGVEIVMLTTYEEDDMIFNALCAGACSYIAKRTPLSQIRDAVFTVYRGGSFMSPSIARKVAQHFMPKKKTKKEILTPRQKQIVTELVAGLSYQMIGDKLGISLDTVRDHIRRIYRQLDVNTKMEVVRKSLDGEI